ncbi:thioredoxin [Pasteurellaceae bacterium RH1A]|nr:thioredoxin [Pasteurellaceae bacterium RH1A]
MKKSTPLVIRFLKNILVFGLLFLGLSLVMDWYRKPSAPAQLAQSVLYDLDNQPKVLAQLSHNQPMILYFWGSWCGYCDYTSPAIQSLHEDGLPVLGVALKSGSDEEVKTFLQQKGYSFASINDPDGSFSKTWNIQATPTIILLKDGQIAHHTTGLTSYWGLKARLALSQ